MVFQRKSFMYGVIIGSVTYAIMKWYCEKRTRKKRNITFDWNDDCFLFAPPYLGNLYCRLSKGYCNKFFCSSCNCKKFLDLIEGTRFRLDICVYVITSNEIAEMISRLFMRGIYIRIVMDKQMSQSVNSKLLFFIKKHIPIKLIEGQNGELMHNKFVIIDQQILITGSFNWTVNGLRGNFENGIVIHNKIILQKYNSYYEFIWNLLGKLPATCGSTL